MASCYTDQMLSHVLLYSLSFVGLWIGSGLAIKSVERLSGLLKVSSFLVSFLVLGLFTSISELSVGINSILNDDPEIYVGNLIGASIVIFLLIIPILAIIGRSIGISLEFRGNNLPAALLVVSLPVVFSMDGSIGRMDAIFSIIMFVLLLFSIQSKKSLLERIKNLSTKSSVSAGKELVRVVFGITLIFIASRIIVQQTLFFSEALGVSPFLISLLVISLGTNIPELTMVVRASFMNNFQIAFGNYVGSATFNTFLFGVLTLLYGKPIQLTNSYLVSLIFFIFGLCLFYYFARTKNRLSRLEGLVLLVLYVAFVLFEIISHKP